MKEKKQVTLKGKKQEQKKKMLVRIGFLILLIIAFGVFLFAASGHTSLASFAKGNQKAIIKLNSAKGRKSVQGIGGGRVGSGCSGCFPGESCVNGKCQLPVLCLKFAPNGKLVPCK